MLHQKCYFEKIEARTYQWQCQQVKRQKIQFGVERNVANGIVGLELLEEWKKEQGELDGEDNEEGISFY